MGDRSTVEYLNANISGVLSKGLAEMAKAQPTDGVNFLSQWLNTYAEQEERKELLDRKDKAMEADRTREGAKAQVKEKKRKQKVEEDNRNKKNYDQFLEKLNADGTAFTTSIWMDLINGVQTCTGATAVYLGVLDEEGIDDDPPVPCICYTAASKGSEWITERVLRQGFGVTWSALTENADKAEHPYLWKPPSAEPPPPPLDDDPEAQQPPEAPPPDPYNPVRVEHVTDVPQIEYFHMTRLGAYVAIPLVYSSFRTSEALECAKTFETEKLAVALAKEEERKAAEEEKPESPDPVEGEAPAPPEPEPELDLMGKDVKVKMILCMDTLGTNTSFETSKVVEAMELCSACAKCKSRTEVKEVHNQAKDAIAEKPPVQDQLQQSKQDLAEEFAQDEAAMQEDFPEGVPDEHKDLLQKKIAYKCARAAALALEDQIMQLATWVYVPMEMMNLLAGLALLIGYNKASLYPKRKSALKWEQLKAILSPSFFDKIQHTDAGAIVAARTNLEPEQKLASIKALAVLDEIAETKARDTSPGFEIIFTLLSAACNYRSADLEVRKNEYMKRKEEAGDAFSEPLLENLDDDFVP